ncbi:alpha/beta hydrolase family protein [Agrobacterium deltaense]|uniref:alpha/beta hydrolase family protein n=1 Tax=Agrobacterium deltaense TaxID=1183412 RepID=UPI000F638027|nr:alpha/beta fold hydrolase [Agrobacterium deltaense]
MKCSSHPVPSTEDGSEAADLSRPTSAIQLHGDEATKKLVVIIQPATAVPESLYHAFASYLAERGFLAVTYNYSGVGAVARCRSSRSIRMVDWVCDADAVIDAIRLRFPSDPLVVIGHSFGGHAAGLSHRSRFFTAVVLVASHAGSMRFIQPRLERAKATFLLHILGPVLTKMLGYMPGRRLGIGEDLPAGVMRQWRQWTKLKHYFFDDPRLKASARFAELRCPILCYSFSDDPWATEPAVGELVRHFKNADVERRRVDTKALGTGPIGHFGFFRQRHRDHIWPGVAQWLEEVVAAQQPRFDPKIDHD